jgi:hypothetical protein
MAALRKRSWRVRAGSDEGAELVELAIVLPILLLVLAAIMDFGFLFQRYEVVTNAAREGARLGSLPGYSVADVRARVQNYLAAGGLDPVDDDDIVVTTGVEAVGAGNINVITVDVSYEHGFSFIGPFVSMFGGTPMGASTLRAVSTMRLEQAAGSD